MKGDIAARVGQKLSTHHQEMGQVVCGFADKQGNLCGATFWIIHPDRTASVARIKKQGLDLTRTLRAEHIDQADSRVHRDTYELD
ncbi:MAG TPA: hypothetical protein VKV95_04545 [Terriglobia bacterium]|nr:hypothetical protein [Terriglobia bacterium]